MPKFSSKRANGGASLRPSHFFSFYIKSYGSYCPSNLTRVFPLLKFACTRIKRIRRWRKGLKTWFSIHMYNNTQSRERSRGECMGSWLFLELRQQLFVGPGFIPPNYCLLPYGSRPALQQPEILLQLYSWMLRNRRQEETVD
ncbi:hypothetical protein V6N12_037972 [Hibiscus sabdariffa]|uniref:Uncharacterized protein n=1 Tax=Hibiscus sabdariffa TaxID=183260 RepID=A0ABR2BDZ7_9ROSI